MTPWTLACRAPLSMGFPRQEYWSGFSFPSPEYIPEQGLNPHFLLGRQIRYHLVTSSSHSSKWKQYQISLGKKGIIYRFEGKMQFRLVDCNLASFCVFHIRRPSRDSLVAEGLKCWHNKAWTECMSHSCPCFTLPRDLRASLMAQWVRNPLAMQVT